MARFESDKIEEIRTRADIVEVIGAHVRLKRAGRNFVGLCPFHNEKTPSFSVNAERGFFHCFGCGAGGTVFDFVMRIEGLTFPDALQSLARHYGIALPQRGEGGGASAGERDAFTRANQIAAEFYAHVLWNTDDGAIARDYLKARGIASETAREFMLGFAPARTANLAATLSKRGLLDAAITLGLVHKQADGGLYDMFRARVMFPIRDVQSRVIGFGGRVVDNHLPKYINSAESPVYSKARVLYGLREARQAIGQRERAIVVEGYLDAITLWQAGFREVVASLGTSLTIEQVRLLSRYTRNIVACFDGDDAGRRASLRALDVFLQAGILARGVFIPQGFDPDTLIRERGAAALDEPLKSAESLIDYFLQQQAQAARASVNAQARAAERVAEVLRLVTNPFEFDIFAHKASAMLRVSEEVLRKEARRSRGKSATQMAPARPPRNPPPLTAMGEARLGLIAIALQHPELRDEIAIAAALDDDPLAALLKEVCSSQETRAVVEIAAMAQLNDDQRGRLSALVLMPEEDPAKIRAITRDYIAALTASRRRREVEELRHAAASFDADEAIEAAQKLISLRRQPGERC